MPDLSVSVPEALSRWLEQRAQSVGSADASAYVADLIRRDQVRVEMIAATPAHVTASLSSGQPQPIDPDAFLAGLQGRTVLVVGALGDEVVADIEAAEYGVAILQRD